MPILLVPKQLEGDDAFRFVNQLAAATEAEALALDFSNVQFVRPFATLLLAESVRTCVEDRRSLGLSTEARGAGATNQALSYLRHVGFFKFVGLNVGKYPAEAPGSPSYLPITILRRRDLKRQDEDIQRSIEREAVRLANIVVGSTLAYNEVPVLHYCLREVIRNVFEHAATDECSVMAQRWSNGSCEIAIADRGRGILASLRETHTISYDEDALKLAIQPGVSGVGSADPDQRANGGFGLYVLSTLGSKFGLFSAASNTKLLCVSAGGHITRDLTYRGTAIQLSIRVPERDSFLDVLPQIVDAGVRIIAAAGRN